MAGSDKSNTLRTEHFYTGGNWALNTKGDAELVNVPSVIAWPTCLVNGCGEKLALRCQHVQAVTWTAFFFFDSDCHCCQVEIFKLWDRHRGASARILPCKSRCFVVRTFGQHSVSCLAVGAITRNTCGVLVATRATTAVDALYVTHQTLLQSLSKGRWWVVRVVVGGGWWWWL